jgi:hypothetical protein
MNQDVHIAATIHLAFALVCLWVLVFMCWRTYRVDALRQQLFALRDELFDYATSGAISYDDPAYGKLRLLMNGMIRFAHRLSFPRLLLAVVVNSLWPDPYLMNVLKDWHKSIEAIPQPETRKKLHEFNCRMNDMLIRHLLTGSPTFLILLVFFAAAAIVSGAVWSFLRKAGATSLQILEAEAAHAQMLRGRKKAYA